MDPTDLCDGWPGSPSAAVVRLVDGSAQVVVESGDLDERRPWASVSKLTVAVAVGVDVDRGRCRYDQAIGSSGSTLAHLLSHSGGYGLESLDRPVPVGTRRVYSNVGIDLAVGAVTEGTSPSQWLAERVFDPLGMESTDLEGRPSAGVVGSTRDLITFVVAWLLAREFATTTRDRIITPFLPQLDGVVPGFGRFRPCPWGLGPEVRGSKEHWMGDWPPDSAGHFGQSGALALFNVREGIAVVATSTVPFGPWAVALWPAWTSRVRQVVLAQ